MRETRNTVSVRSSMAPELRVIDSASEPECNVIADLRCELKEEKQRNLSLQASIRKRGEILHSIGNDLSHKAEVAENRIVDLNAALNLERHKNQQFVSELDSSNKQLKILEDDIEKVKGLLAQRLDSTGVEVSELKDAHKLELMKSTSKAALLCEKVFLLEEANDVLRVELADKAKTVENMQKLVIELKMKAERMEDGFRDQIASDRKERTDLTVLFEMASTQLEDERKRCRALQLEKDGFDEEFLSLREDMAFRRQMAIEFAAKCEQQKRELLEITTKLNFQTTLLGRERELRRQCEIKTIGIRREPNDAVG